MIKKFTFLMCCAFQFMNAQHTVTGVFTDSLPEIKDVALYKIVKGTPAYVKYVAVKDKQFSFMMDSLSSGCYRALYKNVKTGYVDFIYNNESVAFSVDSNYGQPSVAYTESRENQLLFAYNYNMNHLQYKLDSVQMQFFSKSKDDVTQYQKIKKAVDGAQEYYESLAQNDYCLGIIKASKRWNAPLPFLLPDTYLKNIVLHFFDAIDFKDDRVRNSTFLTSRIKDYVFYLHQSDDVIQQNSLYIKSIKEVLAKADNDGLREEILRFLIPELIARENNKVLSQVIEFYEAFPKNIQSSKVLSNAKIKSKTLLGVIAPDIKISKKESLYSLRNSEKYLIVFWSSTCFHCSLELPKVVELLKSNKDITVITVGLEKATDREKWEKATKAYKSWKNVIAVDKWESKEAIDYDVSATPTYFLLNKDKRIISKPKSLEALKNVLK